MRYLISIEERDFRKHPDYTRITSGAGETIILEDRYNENNIFFIGKENNHCYFFSPNCGLDKVIENLLKHSPEATIKIQIAAEENFPTRIMETYKRFFRALEEKTL